VIEGGTELQRLRLIHWKAVEAEKRATTLEAAGYAVDRTPFSRVAFKELAETPPSAVVIDLTRMPSQGRDVAVSLRKAHATRRIPIVFVGGDQEKVDRIREILPDATYTSWSRVRSSLRRAIAHPPDDPVQPESIFAAYAGTPLPKKLGIKKHSVVALVGAPESFLKRLGPLPEGVVVRRGARGRCDLAIWFAKSRRELESRVEKLGAFAGDGGLWITWPKKASGVRSDLTQAIVRSVGLASGLVDYKVCAIDQTWSGLKFTRRRKKR
jgi:CheY-like chemotaxis protein